MSDTFTKQEIEQKFIAQEHRTLRVWHNFYLYAIRERSDPARRSAAVSAAISWFLSPAGIISITLPIGAVVGAYLAWNANLLLGAQNDLLEKQNKLIVTQNIEMRASRETQIFVSQLGPIIDLVTAEEPPLLDGNGRVDVATAGRIVTFVQTLGPYVETIAYGETFLHSPERARLMTALYSVGFPFDKMPQNVRLSFAKSLFENVSIEGVNLTGIDLSGSDMRSVDFRDTKLINCDLGGSLLPSPAAFLGADLSGCELSGAYVEDGNWIDRLIYQVEAITTQTRPCPDEFKRTEFDIRQWVVSPDAPHRIWKDLAASDLGALLAELDLMNQGGIFDPPFQPDRFEERFEDWIAEAVAALNAQVMHSDRSSPIARTSLTRGDFVQTVTALGIPLDIFIRRGASFEGVSYDWTRRVEAVLSGDLRGARFANADISGFSFVGADLSGADMSGAKLPAAASFSAADLEGINFDEAIPPDRQWLQELGQLQEPPRNFDADTYEVEIISERYHDCDDPTKFYDEVVGARLVRKR